MRLLSGSVAAAHTLLARPSVTVLSAPRLFARASSSTTDALRGALNDVLHTRTSPDALRAASNRDVRAEQRFAARPLNGLPVPPSPTTEGRSVSAFNHSTPNYGALWASLRNTIARSNLRGELKLGERYEKPNQERRRKRSERHRRRFKDLVRQKVQLVSARAREMEMHVWAAADAGVSGHADPRVWCMKCHIWEYVRGMTSRSAASRSLMRVGGAGEETSSWSGRPQEHRMLA